MDGDLTGCEDIGDFDAFARNIRSLTMAWTYSPGRSEITNLQAESCDWVRPRCYRTHHGGRAAPKGRYGAHRLLD